MICPECKREFIGNKFYRTGVRGALRECPKCGLIFPEPPRKRRSSADEVCAPNSPEAAWELGRITCIGSRNIETAIELVYEIWHVDDHDPKGRGDIVRVIVESGNPSDIEKFKSFFHSCLSRWYYGSIVVLRVDDKKL